MTYACNVLLTCIDSTMQEMTETPISVAQQTNSNNNKVSRHERNLQMSGFKKDVEIACFLATIYPATNTCSWTNRSVGLYPLVRPRVVQKTIG